jgi:hypothetical protein
MPSMCVVDEESVPERFWDNSFPVSTAHIAIVRDGEPLWHAVAEIAVEALNGAFTLAVIEHAPARVRKPIFTPPLFGQITLGELMVVLPLAEVFHQSPVWVPTSPAT